MTAFARVAPAALALAIASAASAEPSGDDKALATELFLRARAELAEGSVAAACRDFAESQRLDPGGGTLLNLALCHEREGRTATAWSELHEAESLALRDGRPERLELARAHIASLEPMLAHLRVVVRAPRPDLVVVRDGTPLPPATWGVAMPVDPGPHAIEARAPGAVAFSSTITVPAAPGTTEIEIPALEAIARAEPSAAPPPTTPDAASAPVPPPASSTPAPPRASTPKIAYVAAGVGVVAVSVGTFFGVRAIARDRESDTLCTPDCTRAGLDRNAEARSAADVSTAAFVVGGAALAVSAYLLLTSGPSSATATRDAGRIHF